MSLHDQIKFVCWGHKLNDVGAVAVNLFINFVVQKTDSREEALRCFDFFGRRMREELEHHYDEIQQNIQAMQEQ